MGGKVLILVDTHVLVWLDLEEEELGPQALEVAKVAWASGMLATSAVSYWEAAMLIRKQRLQLGRPASSWCKEMRQLGIQEIALDGITAALGEELSGLHGDPADRMIIATAINHRMTLMTADRLILDWPGALDRIDARR